MRLFKKHRGENPAHPAHFIKKVALFNELIEATHYLKQDSTEEQAFYMATTALLAITDVDVLQKLVASAIAEADNKAKEVSVLTDMFNAPSTTTNNN